MFKDKLCEAPILHYPDSSKPYTLFTDASKHGWAGVLTQEFETEVKGKGLQRTTPCYIDQWFIPWQPAELGSLDKRGICHIPLRSRNWLSTSQMQTSLCGATIFPSEDFCKRTHSTTKSTIGQLSWRCTGSSLYTSRANEMY